MIASMSRQDEPEWPRVKHSTLDNPYPVGSVGHPVFASARAKLRRAEHAYKAMKLDAEGLRLDHQEALVVELSADRSKYSFLIGEAVPVPSHWQVVTGEVLYNLRSALDHAAYELSVRGLGRDLTPDEARGSQFPIFKKPKEFRDAVPRYLPGVDADSVALIERVQPYAGRGPEYMPTQFDESAFYLGLLNELANIEKHRYPHLVVQAVSGGSWLFEHQEPSVLEGPIEAGRVFATMPYYAQFVPYVSMQPRFTFNPMLVHADGPSHMPGVLWVLNFMIQRVFNVLDPSPFYSTTRAELLEPLAS